MHPGVENPFSKIFLLDGYISTSSPDDPRYRKTYWDLAFISYYVVFFSFVRQTLASKVSIPLARYFGLRKEAKIDRYAEQAYAFFYFAVSGTFGYVCLSFLLSILLALQLRTVRDHLAAHQLVQLHTLLARCAALFRTYPRCINIFLPDYPYWDIKPEVKRYYLMQFAYWWQQLIVLVLGLEKPRKDYAELVAHHFVTLWLVGYVKNLLGQ